MSSDGWKENLSQYKNAAIVKEDVQAALKLYKDLKPKIENFTFNDGRSCDLLCLDGTIPVLYQSAVYHIPIAVFLYEAHPYHAPMVYVRPTSSMQIKPTEYVDNTGLVSVPYLSSWKYPSSNLCDLLGVLQTVFGQFSPVFAKTAVPTPSSLPYPLQPPAAYAPQFYPPPPPPRLPGMDNPYVPAPMVGVGWQLPPPMGPAQIPQLPVYTSPFPDLPPLMAMPTNPTSSANNRMNAISDEQLLLSLRTAVTDKIRRAQTELTCQYGDELKAIQQAHSDLQQGSQRLQHMLALMAKEHAEASNALQSITKKTAELSELVRRLSESEKEPVNVDETVNATLPLYRQLLSSFAEEQAVEDGIYYLGKALGKGVLELDVFLKNVRELSRRQFMLRATVQLCREKAGLPT